MSFQPVTYQGITHELKTHLQSLGNNPINGKIVLASYSYNNKIATLFAKCAEKFAVVPELLFQDLIYKNLLNGKGTYKLGSISFIDLVDENIEPKTFAIYLKIQEQSFPMYFQQPFNLFPGNLQRPIVVRQSLQAALFKPQLFDKPTEVKTNECQIRKRKKAKKGKNAGAELYKTELCRHYINKGSCLFGSKCQFAHGDDDLRLALKPSNYKTKMCNNISSPTGCSYGSGCNFAHSKEELRKEKQE